MRELSTSIVRPAYAGRCFELTWALSYGLSCANIAHIVLVILFAKATATTLDERRLLISCSQTVGSFVCAITDRAPWISSVRK